MDEICVFLFFSHSDVCIQVLYTCLSRTNKCMDLNLFVMSEKNLDFGLHITSDSSSLPGSTGHSRGMQAVYRVGQGLGFKSVLWLC